MRPVFLAIPGDYWPATGGYVYNRRMLDLAPAVRVNGVAPGAVMWPSDGKPYDDQQAMLSRTPLRRAGTPDDVAGTVLWLLRDAPFVTGQIIRVDGGRTLSV